MSPAGYIPELVLSAPPAAAAPRVEKAHDYPYYVPIYKKGIRTLKWYVQQGRAAPGGPDLPPLDDPASMPIWWGRVMKQSCPPDILNAAQAAAAPPVVAAPSAPAPAGLPPPLPRLENPAVTSQEQSLQHLQEQLSRARQHQLSLENEDPPDFAKIEAAQRKWRELRGEVEKAEEAIFKLRSKQGKLVDQEQFGALLLPKLVTVAMSMRFMRTRLRPQLEAAKNEEEAERIWQQGIDDAFGELIASGFIHREHLALAA